MIFFHGTIADNIKNIKKYGLLDATTDQWILEVTGKNVCCLSKEPSSGEGGNAAYFAGRTKNCKKDGYLVVVRFHREILEKEKLITIFDNKILDDYALFHFFIRDEFRRIGYMLYEALAAYQTSDPNFSQWQNTITCREAKEEDAVIFETQEKKKYYRQLYEEGKRHVYCISGIDASDEFMDFIKKIGGGKQFYEFLSRHFKEIKQAS